MRKMLLAALALVLCVSALRAEEQTAPARPVELGAVPWERDFDKAVKTAKAAKKPLLVLFQEVPG